MKFLVCTASVAAVLCSGQTLGADVGVSVSVAQPGFYGRIDIGNLPPPQLVYAEPILIQPAAVVTQPIYLRVPPGHAKNWGKHCRKYNACGQPVYFVQESWYNNVYVPHYRHGANGAAVPAYALSEPPRERVYEAQVRSVRAVVGPPEQRCWIERQQVVEERSDGPNVPGAIVGAVVGGVVGHQIGNGRGRDLATAGGAVAGAAIGADVGRGADRVYNQDVQRCVNLEPQARPEYWDVTYQFRGVAHRAKMSAPPGRYILVDENGVPRR